MALADDLLPAKREFIVICQSAWMNDAGFGIHYGWDGERFATRKAAIKHGWEIRDSDDFNIAIVRGNHLVWFGWMDEPMETDDGEMTEIAKATGLHFGDTPAAALRAALGGRHD